MSLETPLHVETGVESRHKVPQSSVASNSTGMDTFSPQGRAGIQSPTTTNYAAEFPTFGKIEGISISGVQKISLTLGKLSL